MKLLGKNIIGGNTSALGQKTFFGFDPKRGKQLETPFYEATQEEVNLALGLAEHAFPVFRRASAEQVAGFLEAVAVEIDALGDALIEQASIESGLGKDRLTGERARTVSQLRLFAGLVKEGSYLDARIDLPLPDRKPIPRPDLRRMLLPVGPVVVFAASNFPLAFSVAGGDTASALAARNPVVVKAHPAHPATSELVASAIARAVEKCRMPEGTFSLLHATDPAISIALVKHSATKAVGFTGSERAGRAIFDAASQRPDPIPAFVEMGSINPVFVLPGALEKGGDSLPQGFFGSINLGVGQFCTCPGVIVGKGGNALDSFKQKLTALFQEGAPGTMLYSKILEGYENSIDRVVKTPGVHSNRSSKAASPEKTEGTPVLFETDAKTWLANSELATEVFGPSAMVVSCGSDDQLLDIARKLPGTLTATVHGTPDDIAQHRDLIEILETKAGRLLFNGFPTGVEVSPAMHHGGPYPATADPKFTSVGTAAILRFLRPVCYQNFPQESLPLELRDDNPRHIWRMVNGKLTQEPVGQLKEA
ncbi:MAG TPA: aldehyde dehydrogenase (NADP(+)) [Bryobacteraceae bacterium]|nr:aldehyde dehydrogenase (NADP(+)) [Bryobacteraceae bacterium]